jgi:hypothetical protein
MLIGKHLGWGGKWQPGVLILLNSNFLNLGGQLGSFSFCVLLLIFMKGLELTLSLNHCDNTVSEWSFA